MKSLAVFFPGVGYNKDRPLLYYSSRLAFGYGFDICKVDFSGMEWDKEALKDHKRLLEILAFCLERTDKALKNVNLSEYGRIFFISKSIGTVVAAAYAEKKSISAKQIYFTPLEYMGSFAENENGIVFYGNKDPYANPDAIEKLCREKHLEAHRIKEANHSLETEDVLLNIEILKGVMERVKDEMTGRSIYSMTVPARDGSLARLSEYRGQVLLIVNTATGCGFTPQYEAIEALYRKFKDDGFTVLDFPCNQFGKQAPGTNSEIHSFCTARYDISFPQFGKVEVNGENELELYTYLKEKQGFKGFGNGKDAAFMTKMAAKEDPDFLNNPDIKWNFTKFLINRQGEVIERFEPTDDMNEVALAVERAVRA